jgi:carboxyl-terminal processing protease
VSSPFVGWPSVAIVLPEGDPALGGERTLLELERAELEAILGAPIEFVDQDPGAGARWVLELEGRADAPTLSLNPGRDLLVSRAHDTDGLVETFSLLPTLLRSEDDVVRAAEASSVDEAIDEVVLEVADWYPSLELRGLDWDAICGRHVERVQQTEPPLPAFQRWLAELQDAHTWVAETPRPGNLPYALTVSNGAATFTRVPDASAARAAGVRVGWRLVGIDDATVDLEDWWARTGAPPHAKPYITGRRLLAGPVDRSRALTAESPSGARATWQEQPERVPSGDLVTYRRLAGRVGYVRVEAWIADREVEDALDAALSELRQCARLVFDLRANVGGNLVLACATRDRFLHEETVMGSIRYSIGGGRLSEPFAIKAGPAQERPRWAGQLVVLTDSLTYSASEDFLLGLHGLDHVHVIGEPTGGGSGRPRTLRLISGYQLTISSALTYDRTGHCIEGRGIPVDVHSPPDGEADAALRLAIAC